MRTFITVEKDAAVPDVDVWLFLLDDGQSLLAASWEDDGKLMVGRFDPDRGVKSADRVVFEPGDIAGYDTLHDHWHIYVPSTGSHWIAFSLEDAYGDHTVGLVKFDSSFTVEWGPMLVQDLPLGTITSVTNDLYMAETADGVAIFIPDFGARGVTAILVDAAGGYLDKEPLRQGGFAFSHGGSATYDSSLVSWTILAPATLDPCSQSAITRVELAYDWSESSSVLLDAIQGGITYNLAMPMAVTLPSGARAMVVRRRPIVPCVPGEDAGEILLYVFDASWNPIGLGVPYQIAAIGNRPHILYYVDADGNGKVIVTWDDAEGAYFWVAMVWVDNLSVTDVPIESVGPAEFLPETEARWENLRVRRERDLTGYPGPPEHWELDESRFYHRYWRPRDSWG